MSFEEEIGFVSVSKTIKTEREERRRAVTNRCYFGVKYLDALLAGILPHDLILLGAATGAGKTELVSSIGVHNALEGKRVYMFALEADHGEIERRLKYKLLTKYYLESKDYDPDLGLNYQDWYLGEFDSVLEPYEARAEEQIEKIDNLKVYYREESFGIREFQKKLSAIKDNADLVMADHIHFFDMESSNQLKELGDITKKIRDLVQIYRIPVLLVGHLRKLDKKTQALVPSIEDFHGSSDLTKMITKGVILAPDGMASPQEARTIMRIVKNRMYGVVQQYVGRGYYNLERNEYTGRFDLGFLSSNDSKFNILKDEELPLWLKRKGFRGIK